MKTFIKNYPFQSLVAVVMLFCFATLVLTSCVTSTPPNQNDIEDPCGSPEGSVLEATAAHFGLSLHQVGLGLKAGALGVMVAEPELAATYLKFLNDVEALVTVWEKQGASLVDMATSVAFMAKNLPPKVKVGLVTFQEFIAPEIMETQKLSLTTYDWCKILASIEGQKRIVSPFVAVE